MANNSGVQQQQQQRQSFLQQSNSPFHCKECGISLNSAESLEVHLQYHKENLLKHWAIQAASSHAEETNNNTTKGNIKRELISNTVAAADSSDSMQKKSPEYSRATPENMFGHPPTPQSYQSASSPYQNNENSAFSPNFQNYQQIKTERTSPVPHQQQFQQNSYSNNYPDQQPYFSVDSSQNQQYNQEPFVHKTPTQSSYNRYHPYTPQQSPYERRSQGQVSSSSPAYPPQPTPSPSPKVCDKCGYVCESATQLIEHLNISHPPTPAPHLSSYQQNQHFLFDQHPPIKQEEISQSEILDLDSHKVVQNVFPEDEKPAGNDPQNPHSVSGMLNSWSPSQQQQEQQKMYQHHQEQQRNMFPSEQKVFAQNLPEIPENKLFSSEQKLFQPHQIHNQDFLGNGVTTTTQENSGNIMNQTQSYRPFEHMHQSPSNTSVISSTQVPTNPTQPPTTSQKSSNWKSNEARRPKTYNCTACNKWFTSSGHLKRHYNTTLHKNAVKSSGQPDPASLPISAHHHPAREGSSKQDDRPQSGSSGDEIRGEDNSGSMPGQFDRLTSIPGLLQQPPNGPYDRQPVPNIHHTPPLHSPMPHSPMPHSPMPQHPSPLGNHLGNPNLSNGSPPNGEAGLSTTSLDSRGLLSISSPPLNTGSTHHGYNMAPQHLISMENNQFQMYPNELAPHVMQAMAINNLNTTGEFHFSGPQMSLVEDNQPLPSFAQIQAHRFGIIGYDIANVGGGGTVTAPYTFYSEQTGVSGARTVMYHTESGDEYNKDYRLTVLTANDPPPDQEEYILGLSPSHMLSTSSESDSKIHTMEETKMEIMEDIKQRLEAQPKSPEKAHTKRDYEETAGSPLISSTVKQPGLHKCYDCDKVFNKACYLTQHNKTFHSGDKPFKCTRCGKRFSCEITYQEHLSKHAGDKPHKCDLCPKQFNHKTDLRRHMCLHTGQKPYACDTCGKGFIRKDHMMKHCETHLRKTQSKFAAIR